MKEVPESIGDIFEKLKTEIMWLHARWKLYRQIFAHNEKRIDLLNECAPVFFIVIHGVLVDEVQVTLSKLTDSARTGRYENLSFEQIQKRVEALGNYELSSQLRKILDDLHDKCKVFRHRRNKRLAHFDLNTALELDTEPLPGVSRQMIEDALRLVREYMNTIGIHYAETQTGYEHPSMSGSDGEALISWLKDGLDFSELAKKLRKERPALRSGRWNDA